MVLVPNHVMPLKTESKEEYNRYYREYYKNHKDTISATQKRYNARKRLILNEG